MYKFTIKYYYSPKGQKMLLPTPTRNTIVYANTNKEAEEKIKEFDEDFFSIVWDESIIEEIYNEIQT